MPEALGGRALVLSLSGLTFMREVRHGRRCCGHCGQRASGLVTWRGAVCAPCGRRSSRTARRVDRSASPTWSAQAVARLSAGWGRLSTVVHSSLWTARGRWPWGSTVEDVLWRKRWVYIHTVIHSRWRTPDAFGGVAQVSERSRCAHSCGRACGRVCTTRPARHTPAGGRPDVSVTAGECGWSAR